LILTISQEVMLIQIQSDFLRAYFIPYIIKQFF
jgi:hypothetical protein